MLNEADARYFAALVAVREVIGQEGLHFERLPEALEALLDRCRPEVLFSVIAECLERLLGTETLQRVKEIQIEAGASPRIDEGNGRRCHGCGR